MIFDILKVNYLKSSYLLLIILIFCIDAYSKSLIDTLEYEDGIFVEPLLSSKTDRKDYNEDNVIFTVNKKFVYSYSYQKNNKNSYFKITGNRQWEFINVDEDSLLAVNSVNISVLPGLEPFIQFDSTYRQTIIKIDYPSVNGIDASETTGVIENNKNLWVHPPRIGLFRILELNPFPFIQKPFVIGNEWNWELRIGETWGDARWKTWKGIIKNIYKYKITGEELLCTEIGNLTCLITEATANSELGETYLKSYYNESYGFVRYEFRNIDGSVLIFNLIKVE